MAFSISTDAVEVYRGLESKIKDLRLVPIVNGRIYFATDTDKVFYDAEDIRHEISGGSDVSFITATSSPTYDGETGYYVFQRANINATKLAIDNIILAPEADNSIYRVLIIDEENGIVKTKQIAGGGGGGGGVTNPLTITVPQDFPERTIDNQDVTCIIKVGSIISTDETCVLQVFVNGQEITSLGSLSARLREERPITIPHELYSTTERNTVEIVAEVDENVKSKKLYFYAFHSEFNVPTFNPRQPFGTDISTGVSNIITMNYTFTGLSGIKGHIHMYIDDEELFDLSDESNTAANMYGGGAIIGNGQLNIPCTIDAFSDIEHGNHTLTLAAYAVVENKEYYVSSLSWDIIWATAMGGNAPIIISNYNNTQEENYNIINIPYIVYAKGVENIEVHLYVNGDELATSPITVQYDKSMADWNIWAISKYIPNIVNNFRMIAMVDGEQALKEFNVEILPSDLMLDAESESLLLYLSALDRSNKESAVSRQTWEYTNSSGTTYSTIFNGFNWNNDGWQLDDNGDNVLRLNNGAYIDIPFTGILQESVPNPGFTIEVEFRCRNATSFAKLMSYKAKDVQATDEAGNALWEQEPEYDTNGNPIMTYVLDSDGERIQERNVSEQLAYEYRSGEVDEETGDPIVITVYEHTSASGVKTYYLEDNVPLIDGEDNPITPSASQLTPIYKMEVKTKDKLDDDGHKIPVMLKDGAVEKRINYITNQDGSKTVANAVGTFFASEVGMCIGTQEAFFASTGKKVNVRYADNDKVKVSVVADNNTKLLYIYINAVLSGVERFGNSDDFKAQGVTGLRFNSDYCDLDLYTIRIYKQALNFDGIVQNWIGDAPNLEEKRKRYMENHITQLDRRNGYVNLDYDLTKALSAQMAANYKAQVEAGVDEEDEQLQPGLPIMVITTYPPRLSDDTMSDYLPYNKEIKKYVDMRFWDPNYDPDDPNTIGLPGFHVQDFELSVQGTSSQGYPRRNYKAKVKATKEETNLYASRYPFYWSTWDGDDEKRDMWPSFDYPEELDDDATEQEKQTYKDEYKQAEKDGWDAYALATGGSVNELGKIVGGYKQLEAYDIGNGFSETNFCFKADYMDSSSTHNTSLADYIDIMCRRTEGYNLIHPMKRQSFGAGKKYRQTVYGFPMLVFWDHKGQNTKPEFVGRYNFNIDKSATTSFGFTLKNKHPVLQDVDYMTYKTKIKNGVEKKVKDDYDNLTPITKHGDPTIADICECWELTSNQHGFTGFRRNDFDALDDDGKLDFYNFFENRYSIMDFDPEDVYKGDSSANKGTAIANLKLYAKNIIDLSRWIYSTDVHPWDGRPEKADVTLTEVEAAEGLTIDEKYNTLYNEWFALTSSHKLTQVVNGNSIKYTVDPQDRTKVNLLRDYYTMNGDGITVSPVSADQFKLIYSMVEAEPEPGEEEQGGEEPQEPTMVEVATLKVYYPAEEGQEPVEMPWVLLWEDEINAVLSEPAFYSTRDTEPAVTWNGDTPVIAKEYYSAPNSGSPIPASWYHKTEILAYSKRWDATNEKWVNDMSKLPQIVGYSTVINDGSKDYDMSEVYEKYTKDTKEYRLSKYHAEFSKHLNFDYCALYFILTEFFILYDSREKNMMIATWGPEEVGGEYIWYPIFYDMDTQLGINNSGTVFWDYDVNAQDDGIFSGAGSVLWDNFYACFLEEIKAFYRIMRDKGAFTYEDCVKYYNTESADRWTPIMKNVDAFYKYVAPSIDAPGLKYVTKSGKYSTTSSFFYCAQGDRTLNRAAFFRNRFNYKDSEWLGGSYRTQGGANIEMRYDANYADPTNGWYTSDPESAGFSYPSEFNAEQRAQLKAQLDSNATFDIKPYLTQYCSVYYDEIPRTGGRFDIQQEPVVEGGVPDAATQSKYAKNINNIKKSGYITIDPLPAIQDKINEGAALSQQLVYIYGPEYIRDLGDLSLKYLDRFFCQDAIRLNSLVIGNDNPYYKNTGMSYDAFNLDTAYLTPSKTLNKNAKALLQHLDISNLSGLSRDIDISGCLKIKTVKALGTQIPALTLPDGNVIESLYLPKTITTLVLNKAQKLSQIIRQRNRAIAYYMNGEPDVGLYIENITDRMDISRDTDIISKYLNSERTEAQKAQDIASNITNDPNKNNAANPYYVAMKRIEIIGGKLGLASYELLDYVIKQKIKMRYDEELVGNTYSKELLLRLLDVNWSPYEKLDTNAQDQRLNLPSDPVYYVREDSLKYRQLLASETFAYANKNLGGVYKMTNNRLSADGNVGEATQLKGIPDLTLLKMFIADYTNPDRTNTNADNFYMVKDVYEDNNVKFLPHIGGEIFVDNTNGEAIDEYELYSIAKFYSQFLAKDDTKLTICAQNVTPCPRAKFIEIMLGSDTPDSDGITHNGDLRVEDTLRSQDQYAEVDVPTDLIRNDYDFRGWATYDAISTYAPEFLVIEGNKITGNTGGTVPLDSPLLDHLAVKTVVDPVTKQKYHEYDNGNAAALLFGNAQTEYYAVYTLHKYEVKYVLDIPGYIADPTNPNTYEIVLVPSNAYIDAYAPQHVPFYKNDTLPIGKMHEFTGWAADLTSANEGKLKNLHYAIRKDTIFYPVYTVIQSAWDNPLSADYFLWETVVNGNTGLEEIVIYGTTRTLGGRICIPKTIDGKPVARIMGSGWQVKPAGWHVALLVKEYQDGTQIYTPTNGNGFQDNYLIEHIYFQGANDGSCSVRSFDEGAFGRMVNLRYIDFPDSLTRIGQYCFQYDSALAFRDINNVQQIDQGAFRYVNTRTYEDSETHERAYESWHENDLYLPGGDLTLGSNILTCVGWKRIIIGSETDPFTKQVSMIPKPLHSGTAQDTIWNGTGFDTLILDETQFPGVEEIIFYTVQDINDFQNQRISYRDAYVSIIVNNVPV